jgi:hypothetical protein
MILIVRVILVLIPLLSVENPIYLQETKDGLAVEYYHCVLVQSLAYCRRPQQPIELSRDNDTTLCQHNGGKLWRFNELQSNSVNVSTILIGWRSSIERVEQYSRFPRAERGRDGYLCQCVNASSFGKNCEYRLPMGNTFDQTLEWQLEMRIDNSEKVQEYGDVVCYERVGCVSTGDRSAMECNSASLDWMRIIVIY